MLHIEFRHLRTIKAIHEQGGLARAAEVLNITQSALSHQVKGLEDQVGVDLFVRRSKPLKLSAAGMKLLELAQDVLPKIDALEADLLGVEEGRQGRLHIAIECHACFDWLIPVLEQFRKTWPDIDVDIRLGLALDALPALDKEQVDLVITSDPDPRTGVQYLPLFDYAPMCVMSSGNKLASKDYLVPMDFSDQTLFTYRIDRSRLDVFKMFLGPEKIEPYHLRAIELTDVILMLVGANRGVSVLPDWVLRSIKDHPDYAIRPLTREGLTRRMFAAVRDESAQKPFMSHFVRIAKSEAVKLQRS